MSSGKPQTRGLAALLRIERERRAREELDAEESVGPSSGNREEPSASQDDSPQTQPTETDTGTTFDAGAIPAVNQSEVLERFSKEDATPPLPTRLIDTSTPTPSTLSREDSPLVPAKTPTSSVTSLSRGRRAHARPTGTSRKKAGASSESAPLTDPGWEKFVADWGPFLRQGVKFKLCEFFYRNTVAVGRREFITSTAQLSRVSGAHRRHIFLVLRQLEDLRFIRKENLETNKRDEGLLINFSPDRQL